MPVRNYADEIRDNYRGSNKSDLTCLREIAYNRHGELQASAELGKVGIKLSDNAKTPGNSRPDQVAARAELRRAVNTLRDHAKAKPENLTDDILEAVESVTAKIQIIEHQMKMEDTADRMFGNGSGVGFGDESALRDVNGQRIGTMLSNADLRSPSAIASKLKVHDGFNGDEESQMTLGNFLRGVAGMRTTETVRNTLHSGTDPTGGYTVPGVLMPGILSALVPASSLLQAGANVAMLDVTAGEFQIAAIDTIPTAAWRGERGNVAESEPAFKAMWIRPKSLAFRFKVSRELLQDSPGLNRALELAISQAFAVELDRAGLRGSGVGAEPAGLLNRPGVQLINMALPDGAPLTNYSKLINVARLIKEANAPAPTAAIMSPREDEKIALFADTTGQPLRRPDALSDWKFLTTSQIPTDLTVGASDDCSELYTGDFSLFSYFIREGINVQLLKELYAETGEVGFICHTRVDVAAMYPAAFAILTGITAD